MTSYRVTHLRLWKSAKNGLLAHIYEHIAAQKIDEYMSQHGLFLATDYDLRADTFGTTCFLTATFYSKDAMDVFNAALHDLARHAVSSDDTSVAVSQCAIEHRKSVEHIDQNIATDIALIHDTKWQDINSFLDEQAIDSTSVNTTFDTSGLRLTDAADSAFESLIIEYTLEKDTANTPAHKALGVIIVQAIALNFYRYLSANYTFYDIGDEWAYGADDIGYRTRLNISNDSQLSAMILQKEFDAFLHQFAPSLAQSIKRVVKTQYSQDFSAVYFDQKYLNQILGGITIGGKGWADVASIETISSLIASTQIDAYNDYR